MNFRSIFKAAALAVAIPAFAGWTVPTDSETGKMSAVIDTDTSFSHDGDEKSTVIYTGVSYTFAKDVVGTVEVRNDLEYRKANVADTKFKHVYTRFPLDFKNIAEIGPFKFSQGLRYRAPTDNGNQKAGSLGQFSLRPRLDGSFGFYSVMIRDTLSINAHRSRAQRYGTPGAAAANVLWANTLELANDFALWIEGLSFTAYFADTHAAYAKTSTANARYDHVFEQDYELSYSGPAIYDFKVGIAAYHSTTYNEPGVKSKLWSDDGTVNFRLAKSF